MSKAFQWLIKKFPDKEVRKFFVIFYCIGIIGLLIPYTQELFRILTPWAILTGIFYIFVFHEQEWNRKTILVFSIIYISGLTVEIVGVNTGLIFGNYTYGDSLGFKLLHTPIIIGLNWLFLIYSSAAIVQKYFRNKIVQIISGAGLMVFYDLLLEQVAPRMDMWSWHTPQVPVQNYISWFIISTVFMSLISISNLRASSRIAPLLLLLQFIFFLILFLFLN